MNQPTQEDQIALSGEQEWPVTKHEFAHWRGRLVDLTFTAHDRKPRDMTLHVGVRHRVGQQGYELFAHIGADPELVEAAYFYLDPESSIAKRDGIVNAEATFARLLAARLHALVPDEARLSDEEWKAEIGEDDGPASKYAGQASK